VISCIYAMTKMFTWSVKITYFVYLCSFNEPQKMLTYAMYIYVYYEIPYGLLDIM